MSRGLRSSGPGGTGGMLTVAEETLTAIAASRKQDVRSLLYGQEINPKTYAALQSAVREELEE